MGFRLGLVNPNTTQADTAAMAALARAALPGDAEVLEFTAAAGHASIEGEVEHVDGAVRVLELIASAPGLDGYLVACFDDPGLHAARELATAPVVGIGEAAYRSATLLGRRFAVVTTLPRGVAALEDAVRDHGLAHRCVGVLPLGTEVADQRGSDAAAPIAATARRAVQELGADVVVLACGAMAASAEEVAAQIGAPACDGVAFGALSLFALWRCGLRTSKLNAYAPPHGAAA
jgi:allantoin racemase